MTGVKGLNTNEWKWWDYLKQQSADFLQQDARDANELVKCIEKIWHSHQSFEVELPLVETHNGSPLLEKFKRDKLVKFLSKLEVTCQHQHHISSQICDAVMASQIANTVKAILRDESFARHLPKAVSRQGSLPNCYISIEELMGVVVIAAAARGIHFTNCQLYPNSFSFKTPLSHN